MSFISTISLSISILLGYFVVNSSWKLKAIKCIGEYRVNLNDNSIKEYSAAFLSKDQLEIIEYNNNEGILIHLLRSMSPYLDI
jgi:hypothetical protein